MPGRLKLTVKFSELPRPLPVPGGLKVGVQTAEGTVTAILPAKVWKKFEQAAKTYPHWVPALSGSLERFKDGEIALKHPALQGFEKMARPEAAPPPPTPVATPAPAPTPKMPEAKATEAKAPAVPASNPNILRATLSLKGPRKP